MDQDMNYLRSFPITELKSLDNSFREDLMILQRLTEAVKGSKNKVLAQNADNCFQKELGFLYFQCLSKVRMVFVRPPFLLRVFNGKYLTCSIPETGKIIYLTLDDGPVPEITPVVLGLLNERKIKATFFCAGSDVKKYPDLFEEVCNAGHAIGNHTYHHLNGWKTPTAEYVNDVMRCNEFFKTSLFRPPYGKFTLSQYFLLRKQFRFILWSALSGDYNQRISKEQCLRNVINYTKPGSIVVFHDSIKASENMLYAPSPFPGPFPGGRI